MRNNIIYQGNSTISVEILPDYAHPVVIKKPAELRASRRNILSLEKEYEMTRYLDEVEGVRKAYKLQSLENQTALVLEYVDGKTLKDYITEKTLDLRSRLEIAIVLTRILAKIHEQNVIHLDLNSQNILIGNKQQAVHLIDLGSASHIDRSGHQKVLPDQMLGTLPYISPEQTGRINRTVDERSDLYSLGVVLYELMTRQLPFDSKDPLVLVHSHIAREPVSPSEESAEIPEVISAIILKLLRKDAEDRYQSAAGVQADLEKCLQRLSPEDTIEEFPVGEADFISRLIFPQKLYGRDRELKELESAFESVCRESSSIVFVGGYSGIGKTALVEEMKRPVSEKRGYFIRGKFDQYLRTSPYTAIAQAFAEFVSQIMAEPEENFIEWRDRIQLAVGDLGRVLTEMIPALEELIGTQPDVPELGGQEAENRFNFVFINFLSTVATKERPLAWFIDDLHWIDAASLRLLTVIRSEFDQPGLLVIGAYRDNEVDASHPLMEIISNQEKTGLPLLILKLDDLQPQHLEALLSDTLRSRKGVKSLGKTIYDKTEGNPFFSRRLLSSLNEEGRISYDYELNSWKWDVGDIKTAAVSDNVADLLAKNIAQVPEETKNILKLAACIGNRFDVSTLALISGLAEQEVVKLLTRSLRGQYVLESGDTFEFVHDQVQKAGYALIADEDRPRTHLEIGRMLLSNAATYEELEPALFDIAHHFNVGAGLLKSESEKVTVAELDLKAARKAKSTTAYAEGFAYVVQGLTLLDTDSWQHHYDLTLAMHNEAAELSYLTGHYDRLDEIEGRIHKNAKSILDRARVYYIRTMIDTEQGRLLESIETGIGALAELGITIPREPSPEDIERAEADFNEALATRPMEELTHLPAMTDRGALAAMEIMAAILLNAYIVSPQHLSLLTYRGASLSLQHGNGPWSPFFYSVVGLLWAGEVDISPIDESVQALEAALKLAEILLRLLENPRYARCKAKSLDAIMAVMVCNSSMKQLWELSLKIYQAGLDTGDLLTAGLGIFHLANLGLPLGMNLNDYLMTVSTYRQHVNELAQDYMYRLTGIGLQTAQNLMTPCSEPDVLEEQHFDERQWLPDAVAANDGLTLFLVFQAKLLLSYHFDRDGRLMECIGETEKYLDSGYAMINVAIFRFYDSLSRLRLYSSLSADERELAMKRVESNQLRMRIWARSGPRSYQHKYDLVAAEMARVSGDIGPAIENYERAIEGARDNAFIHEEALANELYARFWQERGNNMIAEMYIREACVLYHHWGADAKVSYLEKHYPQWFQIKAVLTGESDSPGGTEQAHTTIIRPITPIQLDMESIISASQMLSAETDLDHLFTKMTALVLANSGAEKAVLLLKQENDWFVQARGDVSTKKSDILLNIPFHPDESEAEFIPEPVFNYCMRSKEVLVVGDAQLDDRFSKDKSIQKHNIKSMACIPILSLGELNAMMYLENRKMADVFSPERIEIIKNISSQFGISVENALLYDNLNLKMQELRESEERLSLIYDSTADILFYIEVEPDDCFRFVSINQSFLEVTGLTREQIIGKRIEEVIPEPSVWMVLDNYKKAIKENRIVRWEETSAYPSGKKTGEVSIAPMNEKGICTYLVGSVHDITERKKAEEEARIQRETIARVSRATRMELLAGSIAHELNQPLTGILSNAQAAELMLQSGQWEPDELAEIMAAVIADTKRSGEVIRNLRELYRKQKGEFAPIDLNTVIDETIQLLHSEVVLQDVVLKTECASSLPLVSGIRIQLQQVFVNLVMNGMQAMSGTEKGNRRILIATALDAMEVKAWVEDCGTGIDADKIDRIFEPLVTWKSGGMGLGLAINNTIIEAHGGRMWVENRREGGARVGFTLPVLKEGKQA